MYQYLEIINKWRDYFVLLIFVIISVILMNLDDKNKIAGFRVFLISNFSNLQYFFNGTDGFGSLSSENKSLREYNLTLSQELIKNRTAKYENEKLRAIIGFKETYDRPIIPTEVVGITEFNKRLYITINIGSKDSVAIGMSVRNDKGLVGNIKYVSENYSVVETLINRNVKVSSSNLRSGVYGILEYDGNQYFNLKNIPSSYDVKKGDLLISSNFSNKYPSGIPVGEIISIKSDLTSLFLIIKVRPIVEFRLLKQVFVLKEIPNPERQNLIMKLEKKFNPEN